MKEKPWREWTEREINKFKKEVCIHCDYSNSVERGYLSSVTCNYILREYKSRGCTPDKCKEKGIFKPRDTKKLKKRQRKGL